MYHRLEIQTQSRFSDPRGDSVQNQIRSILEYPVTHVRSRDVYSIFADINRDQAEKVLNAITNPVIQQGTLGESTDAAFDWLLIIGYLPGVTDNVARTARDAVQDILERRLGEQEQIYSSVEYLLTAPDLTREQAENIAGGLLANPLINSIAVLSHAEWQEQGSPVNQPECRADVQVGIKPCPLAGLTDDELMRLSAERTLALSLAEMRTIRAYFMDSKNSEARQKNGLDATPTDVEIEILAQTWSEHCKHKIFDAAITYIDEEGNKEHIRSCYKTFIKQSTREIGERVDWLVSVFKDNAGVIAFNDKLNLVYKAETHNSPSALDPYGGAMTGIVGCNRDPLGTGMGAELLINVWGYCLASPFTPQEDVPEGLLHPRRIRDGVHQGVIDGGNQSGIPYGVGWEYFDPRYLGKPLVFCGTVGTLPRELHGRSSHEKNILPGDRVVMGGGRIGKDGIHGATFSSEELNSSSPVQAVQIGDPITQKKLSDFIIAARNRGLYRFITDNGAGGLSCSVGEMATVCNGARIDIRKAPLKYAGLQPWEILVSEAQERMTFAVPPESIAEFNELAELMDVEVTDLGEFTDTGVFHITYGDETIACLDLDFLFNGHPCLDLQAKWMPPQFPEPTPNTEDAGEELLKLAACLNITSNEAKARQYDHEVKGLSVIKPFVGVENDIAGDASVFMADSLSREGIILAAAILPRYSDIDTYHMTASVIDLAVRRVIAVGGCLGHIAGLDNFCWPDPVQSEKTPDGEYKLAQLVRANKALYDYTTAFNVPCISGKDSMKNDSTRGGRKISIPPTLLFSVIAKMDDVSKALTLAAKRAGDLVYVLGTTRNELGGSEYYAQLGYTGNSVPKVDAAAAQKLYHAVSQATGEELCHSLHTPALGGLGVGLAKVALGGRLGLDVDLNKIPAEEELDDLTLLFSESNSRFIATVPPQNRERFETIMADLPFACVGQVKYEPDLTLYRGDSLESEVALADLIGAYTGTLNEA